MSNKVLKGRYSMRTFGYTIDDALEIPGALIRDSTGVGYSAPAKVLEPITALGVVGYDGQDGPNGGAISGAGVLRRLSRATFITAGVNHYVRFDGTSGLVADFGAQANPIDLKRFEILPISRYWIDDPENLTGRAVMVVKLFSTGGLATSDISVLSFYFVLEEREKKSDVALKIAFLATDTRHFKRPFEAGAKWDVQPPTPFIEWGIQTRIDDVFVPMDDPTGDYAKHEPQAIDFAKFLRIQQ